MQSEALFTHPVYQALTRPPMFLGITLDYLLCISSVLICLFILSNSAWYLLSYIPLHSFGWLGCRIDINFFRIICKKTLCTRVKNYQLWGCQSYEPQ
jgi:type IV secretion system protein VirB3